MAIRTATRWKSDAYRGNTETTVQWRDKAAGDGAIVRVAQLVAYDDTEVTGANYRPGDPATESKLTLLDSVDVTKELSAFASLTGAQAKAAWDADLASQATAWQPVAALLARAVVSAVRSNPVVMP